MLETERFILRPWREADAPTLFRWASDPRVGPPANWAPYVSVEHARETLHAVYCVPDTFAICSKHPEEFDAAAIARIEGEADFGDMARGFSGRAFLRERKEGGFGPIEPHWQYQVRQARPCQLRYRGQRSGNGNLAGGSLLGLRHRSRKWRARCCATDSASCGLSAIWVCNFVENATSAARRTSSASSLCASRRRPTLSRAWCARSKSRCSRKARGTICRRQPSKSAHSQSRSVLRRRAKHKGQPNRVEDDGLPSLQVHQWETSRRRTISFGSS